jgi:tartrate dehydrogenase/decarboxylase/D-malate dehydrogenase
MLEDLGEESATETLRDAVETHLADPDAPRTPDLGGDAGTGAVVGSVRERL